MFIDILTGQQCEMGLVGNWEQRDAFFWLERGSCGVREPVAKIYHVPGRPSSKYQFDIAPNMDRPMIVIICCIVDMYMAWILLARSSDEGSAVVP